MKETKPICSLSLDLDNQWSYMKTHGDAVGSPSPPTSISWCRAFSRSSTISAGRSPFSLSARTQPSIRTDEALQMIAAAGHEIGNHSFNHEPWLAPLLRAAGRGRDYHEPRMPSKRPPARRPSRISRTRVTACLPGRPRGSRRPRLPVRRVDLPDLPRPACSCLLLHDV